MKKFLIVIALGSITLVSNAQIDSAQILIDSLEARLQYQHGEIKLGNSIGSTQE